MFGRSSVGGDDAHHLLGRGHAGDDEVVWEQDSVRSERHHNTQSEIWEQDPLAGESYELQHVSTPESQPTTSNPQSVSTKANARPEDHGEAGEDLEAEFEKIFEPIKKDQEEKSRFHSELDAACAAYSARLEEMWHRQREREEAIEKPWLVARRRREWQRATTVLHRTSIFLTCFWCGTVARLPEIPAEVPWPPPHLTRMKEHHSEVAKALREAHLAVVREAHLAVVRELHLKYMLEVDEDGEPKKHVCVEKRLLQDVVGELPIPSDDFAE